MSGSTIEIGVSSDVGELREVLLGPHKPFTLKEILGEEPAELDEFTADFISRFRLEEPDAEVAAKQHAGLVTLLEAHGVTVHWADDVDCALQLYTRDMGFAVDDTFFLARPATEFRRGEQKGLASLLPRLSKVHELESGTIEGGDVLVTKDDVLVGRGESTDEAGVESFRAALVAAGIRRDVVALEFDQLAVVHLDVHFTLASPEVGLYNPAAFTAKSREYLESRFDLIEVTAEEVRGLAVNTVALGPDRLVVQHTDERIAEELRRRGITPVMVDFSEITRFPGGLHCATLPLVRR
ncbi:dimethylarginine dimethylaminohydrolase family protein [Pseudonocardia sp. TRM90224]|uniref:dimethylarginine dimethylaminohydrolase family protein n=1 Tax=Pseudonocardia sp. TRM90224 TaxID=2812678 RepID=UPI001E4E536F|nr:arginine deiminase family protein [Pseudonocardia sp. TRM90224]